MVDQGMSPQAVPASATSVAARVLDRDGALGVIAPGTHADPMVLRRDPLKEPASSRRPLVVLKGGAIAVDKR